MGGKRVGGCGGDSRRRRQRTGADLDPTASELNALANLADGRPRSVRALGLDTGTRATTLTGVLNRLERRGYLIRELDAADRRSFRVTLTD